MSTVSLETGAVHADLENATCSGSGRENAPFTRWPGSLTDSVASPAVEITFAVVDAVYSFAAPGVNVPKDGALPNVSESVAGTVPPTGASALASAAWMTTLP